MTIDFSEKLPLELVSLIFTLSFPPTEEYSQSRSGVRAERQPFTPLTLCAVSKEWRRIASGFPGLWSSPSLVLGSKNKLNATKTTLLKEWLARTGKLPLSIQVHSIWNDPAPPRLVATIIKYARRLRHLSLNLPRVASFSFPPSSSFPRLQSLVIISDKSVSDDAETTGSLDFTNSLLLRSVTIRVGQQPLTVNLKWGTLDHLCIEGINIAKLNHIIRLATNVVKLKIDCLGSFALLPLPGNPANLPNAQSIELSGGNNNALPSLLVSIVAPNLTTLILRNAQYIDDGDVIRGLSMLFRRSSCALTKLVLDHVLITDGELLSILQLVSPTLVELSIAISDSRYDRHPYPLTNRVWAEVFDPQLAVGSLGIQGQLPRLQKFDYVGQMSFTWDSLVSAIESRLQYYDATTPVRLPVLVGGQQSQEPDAPKSQPGHPSSSATHHGAFSVGEYNIQIIGWDQQRQHPCYQYMGADEFIKLRTVRRAGVVVDIKLLSSIPIRALLSERKRHLILQY